MNPLGYAIEEITFEDGTRLPLPMNRLLVIVGPNNAGKSQALRDIEQLVAHSTKKGLAVSDVRATAIGTFEEFVARHPGQLTLSGDREYARYRDDERDSGKSITKIEFERAIELGRGFHDVSDLFTRRLSTEGRLRIVEPPGNVDLFEGKFSHPIQIAYSDQETATRLSDFFEHAFGKTLVFSPRGNRIHVHLVPKQEKPKVPDRASKEFHEEIVRFPALSSQGDGMRSYVGTLIHALASPCFVMLIDEPEAFLHPPQARLLGHAIGGDVRRDRQLVIATHSADFLKGVLDEASDDVTIVRLFRDETTRATVLDPVAIKSFWKDAILRNSNLLDGLFHDRVVVCDADTDCRFYAAVVNALGIGRQDLMFFAANGKQGVPKVVQALKAVGVDTVVVADIDAISGTTFDRTIEALGGNPAEFSSDRALIEAHLTSLGTVLTVTALKENLKELLKKAGSEKFVPAWLADQISGLVKVKTGWNILKREGLTALDSGETLNAGRRVIERAASIGLFMVEGGELESFDRSISKVNKALWFEQVMAKDLGGPEFAAAHALVKKFASIEPRRTQPQRNLHLAVDVRTRALEQLAQRQADRARFLEEYETRQFLAKVARAVPYAASIVVSVLISVLVLWFFSSVRRR